MNLTIMENANRECRCGNVLIIVRDWSGLRPVIVVRRMLMTWKIKPWRCQDNKK